MPLLSHSQHQKTAFITGASSGIGRAIAEKLLSENHRVWGTSRDPARLAPLAQKHPAPFPPVPLDLADPDAAQAAFEAAANAAAVHSSQFTVHSSQASSEDTLARQRQTVNCEPGTVNSGGEAAAAFDLVINNAGYGGAFAPFATDDFDRWRRQIDAMLLTTARLSHTALRGMISRNSGTLVNVSSLVVNFPLPYMSAYNTAKAALSALNETLIHETRGTNVTIIDFRPGDYRTDFNKAMAGTSAAAPPTENCKLKTENSPNSRDEVARVWRTIDTMFNTAPHPARAARDLARAIQRGRSGTVRSGSFFQARLAPLAARLLPATLMRSLQARYFGAT